MDDLISRQAAIDALKEHEDDKGYLRGDFEEILEALPSAEPVRMKAKDICDTAYGHCEFKCSACGVEIGVVEGGKLDGGYFKFCPNCGASMSEGEEE